MAAIVVANRDLPRSEAIVVSAIYFFVYWWFQIFRDLFLLRSAPTSSPILWVWTRHPQMSHDETADRSHHVIKLGIKSVNVIIIKVQCLPKPQAPLLSHSFDIFKNLSIRGFHQAGITLTCLEFTCFNANLYQKPIIYLFIIYLLHNRLCH